MRDLLIILFLLGVVSCVSQQTKKLNPLVYYERDLRFEEDDIKFTGIGVLPFKDKYKIKVKGYGKLNVFTYDNCHRNRKSENPDDGIFHKNGKTTINYEPNEVEKSRQCPLYVTSYNKEGKHATGIIYFENPRFKLKAKMICNGVTKHFNGTGACQANEKSIQKIFFDKAVLVSKPANGNSERNVPCQELKRLDEKTFEFNLSNRECNYIIEEKETKLRMILNTVGSEDFIIREY